MMLAFFQARLFLAYLVLTILLETPVLYATIRRFFKLPAGEASAIRIVLTACVASFATYPYVWYVCPDLIADRSAALVFAELLAVLVEAVIIGGFLRLAFARALLASLLCNLTTLVLGGVMNRLIVEYRLFL
jgi:uncharacterized membrane-anchored protein